MSEHHEQRRAAGRIVVVGCGKIGCTWAAAFAAGGYDVHAYDSSPEQLALLPERLTRAVQPLVESDDFDQRWAADVVAAVTASNDLAASVDGAEFVVEAVPDDLDVKQAVFTLLDGVGAKHVVFGSSSSWTPISEIVGELDLAARSLNCHPFHPLNLIPVVELVPGPRTEPWALERARSLMLSVGKRPVVLRREIPGFVGNRVQLAMVREALTVLAEGVCTAEELDVIISEGFALRLPFLGLIANETVSGYGFSSRESREHLKHVSELGRADEFSLDFLEQLDREMEAHSHQMARKTRVRDIGVLDLLALRSRIEAGEGDGR